MFLLFFGFGRRWGWSAHDFLDLVVELADLVLDLLRCDDEILPGGPLLLLLERIAGPILQFLDECEPFLSFFGRDMLVLLILSRL